MPFDATDYRVAPDLGVLAMVLRDRSMWPPRFVWCHDRRTVSGLALARELWGQAVADNIRRSIPRDWYSILVMCPAIGSLRERLRAACLPFGWVTPEDVATAIERHLATVRR